MSKTGKTNYPVHELIRNRWSARAFSDKPISQENVNQILEAASWAFSSMNEQPWRYIYAHRSDKEAFDKMYNCLVPGNQIWAKDAALLILSVAKTRFSNGNLNRHAYHDTGAANSNLFLEATSLGIFGHAIGGFDYQKTIDTFELPEGYEPVIFIAMGYLGAPESLPEPFRAREVAPRERKPLSDFAFHNTWPATSSN